MVKASGRRLFERVSRDLGHETAQRWWTLSEEAHRAALTAADPAEVLRKLDQAASADPASPLSPAFLLWSGDALSRVSRDRQAIAAYDRVLAVAETAAPFEHIDFTRQSLLNRAAAHTRLGDIDAAVESYRELARRGDGNALYEAGCVAERAARFDQALALYGELRLPDQEPQFEGVADRASRAARRLVTDGGMFTPTALGIAQLVEEAVMSTCHCDC
jgi:tetratricopeptide (TPR) repeat protein